MKREPIKKLSLEHSSTETIRVLYKINELVKRVNELSEESKPRPLLHITLPNSLSKADQMKLVKSGLADKLREEYMVAFTESEFVNEVNFEILTLEQTSDDEIANITEAVNNLAKELTPKEK